jgi:hypothetical protein
MARKPTNTSEPPAAIECERQLLVQAAEALSDEQK